MVQKQLSAPLRNRQVESPGDLAFLIAQVGSHAQDSFGKRVDPLGLRLAHVGVLKAIFAASGLTQRELGDSLGMFPSNLVRLIDELERKELVRRGHNASDRRSYTLVLTKKGQSITLELIALTRAHEDHICAALTQPERRELTRLLRKIATDQSLQPGVHPELPGLKSRRATTPELHEPKERRISP
jgi:DNA-binding MarR family transcriptional regulator